MVENLNTLLIRKNGTVYDTAADFGFATGEIGFPANIEFKDFASKSVPGEDGERVFFPEQAAVEAFDMTVEFKYKGILAKAQSDYSGFVNFFRGTEEQKGTELAFYSPWHRFGRQKVYAKKIENTGYWRQGDEVTMKCKVTFRITDPLTHVLLSKE